MCAALPGYMTNAFKEVARIVADLEADIIFGRLLPRTRLIEDEMMARFRAKRHVVRQAFAGLERCGIAVRVPNKGAMVRDFSRQEIEDICSVREMLHARAAALVPLPADGALVARLEALQREHAAMVAARQPIAIHRINNQFHEALFGACGNAYLARTIKDYADLSLAFRCHLMVDPAHAERARDEHAEMIRALKSGDRRRLIELCVRHTQPSKHVYIALRGWLPTAAPARQRAKSAGRPPAVVAR
jgi:DNA-binding GntR family transcriptional regulator